MADNYRTFASQDANPTLASTGLVGVGFAVGAYPFNASMVKVTNNGVGTAYLNFGSTSVGSTAAFQLSSGETIEIKDIGTGIGGFTAVSTSTGTILRYGAWG